MTRTAARGIAVQLIFALCMTGAEPETLLDDFFGESYFATLGGEDTLFAEEPDKKQLAYIRELVTKTAEHREELDGYIEKYSRGWKPERISKTALAVLRCALCEIQYMDDVPAGAAINEAVELAKGYEEPETVAFINGILGSFMREEKGIEALAGAEGAPEPAEEADGETPAEEE